MGNDKDKILIEIATYCDPDLLNTINSAVVQSDHPDRVYFSICYQGDDLKDYETLKKKQNCKIKHLKDTEIKGLCYARYLCQQMIEDEKYIYQVDSHMRFVKHWDTEMINQLLAFHDKKAMISFYPPNIEEHMVSLPVDDSVFDQPTSPTINSAEGFHDDSYFIKTGSAFANPNQVNTLGSPLIAGGNLFAFANLQKDISHDPEMCWYGDELPMSIRYYTHGWNNYCPKQSYIYHKYYRKNRAIHNSYAKGKEREQKRLEQLLNLDHQNCDMGKFGLGKERTLQQFEACTGINFSQKTVSKVPTT